MKTKKWEKNGVGGEKERDVKCVWTFLQKITLQSKKPFNGM